MQSFKGISLIISSLQVDAYEAKNQELMAENTNLRALLRSMQVSSFFTLKLSFGKLTCLHIAKFSLCSIADGYA